MQRALYIHRRDLRVQDNTALNLALRESTDVLPCFIVDPVQVGESNTYRSERQIAFMRESLEDLETQYEKISGKLYIFSGKPHEVVREMIAHMQIGAVYVNADYTPYSKERDEKIRAECVKAHIPFIVAHDLLLSGDPAQILNKSGKPFTVFTPFWKRAQEVSIPKPVLVHKGSFVTGNVPGGEYADPATHAGHLALPSIDIKTSAEQGGRAQARRILACAKEFLHYGNAQHTLEESSTTHLSAHIKFGTVSIREVYHSFGRAIGYEHALLRQLYWRDFYTYIVFHFPRVIGASFEPKHEIIFEKYTDAADPALATLHVLPKVTAWKEGRTGVPIVDAGMRQLAATGYMHNRVRLITGSFLTKDLHLPWWLGEKHFAQQLVDYDISLNNGNWQWVGGTGTDPVPYFRIFNPWLQGKKFDPDAVYIKKWVPELASLSAAQIHGLASSPVPDGIDYPAPIVDHTEEMRKIRALYA